MTGSGEGGSHGGKGYRPPKTDYLFIISDTLLGAIEDLGRL